MAKDPRRKRTLHRDNGKRILPMHEEVVTRGELKIDGNDVVIESVYIAMC